MRIIMKKYEFDAIIQKGENMDASYIEFPYDVRKEFGKGRVKVHATFDGYIYDDSLVRMKTECHIIGIRKEIRSIIHKQAGDVIHVCIQERK